MFNRERVRDFWDQVVNEFLEDSIVLLAHPLDRWIGAFRGRGDGEVDQEAFPEHYARPLVADARSVMLGLNPGVSHPPLPASRRDPRAGDPQGGCYSEVFKNHRVNREPWLTDIGAVGYLVNPVTFRRRWLEDDSLGDMHQLTFELYPWHSKRVTAAMRPEPDIIESMVFDPIAETGVRHVFALRCSLVPAARQHWTAPRADLGRSAYMADRSNPTMSLPSSSK